MPFINTKIEDLLGQLRNTYIGLHIGEPSNNNEVNVDGYTRAASTLDFTEYNRITNFSDLSFGPTQYDFGIITHIGIYDMEVDGNLLYWIEANQVQEVNSGEEYKIPQHNISIEVVM